MTLERRLADLFGYGHCVLFGRGRAGLVAVLEVVRGAPGCPVVVPSNLCPAVIAAIHAAGAAPKLAQVSSRSGLAEDESLLRAMAAAPRPGVVMPCHLYGLLADYSGLRAAAAPSGWFVLENDTLFAAAARDGRRIAFGDALLVSFNHAKTVEAGAGGAVLTDDAALAGALTACSRAWPVLDAEAEAVEHHLTLARRHLRALGQGALGEQLLEIDAAHTRHAFPHALRPVVEAALDRTPALVASRWERVRWWEEALAGTEADLPAPAVPLSVPWRLVRFARSPALRDAVVVALREAGIDAGTNFPPLTDGFPSLLGDQRHDDAVRWGQTVINLWLTEDYDQPRIRHAAEIIRAAIARGPL